MLHRTISKMDDATPNLALPKTDPDVASTAKLCGQSR